MSDSVVVGPVRPEWAVEPRPTIFPLFPPLAFLKHWSCPYCSLALANGTPIVMAERGLAHQACVTDG